MTIKQSIGKAIKGGWNDEFVFGSVLYDGRISLDPLDTLDELQHPSRLKRLRKVLTLEEVVLDPEFWKAVGKVEGWGDFRGKTDEIDAPLAKMLGMVDELWQGKTIEEYLATL